MTTAFLRSSSSKPANSSGSSQTRVMTAVSAVACTGSASRDVANPWTEAGADPRGGMSGHAGRAGLGRAAPTERGYDRGYICSRRSAGAAARLRQVGGALRNAAGRIVDKTSGPIPIWASRISPQWRRPGSSRWPGFRRKNVTLQSASTAAPPNLAGRSVDPGRDVDRENRPPRLAPPRVEAQHDRFGRPVEIARKTGAEQRIDDEIEMAEVERGDRLGRLSPACRRQSGRRHTARPSIREDRAKRRNPPRPDAWRRQNRRRHYCRARTGRRCVHGRRRGAAAAGPLRPPTAAPAFCISV